jgi:hypothetical protein
MGLQRRARSREPPENAGGESRIGGNERNRPKAIKPAMTNEIVESPRILFLGAGASRPFGKMLMGEFVDYLASAPDNADPDLVRAICRKKPDLEFLIEQLEEISTKAYLGDAPTGQRGEGSASLFQWSVLRSPCWRVERATLCGGSSGKSTMLTIGLVLIC